MLQALRAVLDSQGGKPRHIRGFETTQVVTVPWSTTHKQHTSTHYTISLEIYSDSIDIKIKLKFTWEIMCLRWETPRPQHSVILQIYNGSLYLQVLAEMGRFK